MRDIVIQVGILQRECSKLRAEGICDGDRAEEIGGVPEQTIGPLVLVGADDDGQGIRGEVF